MAGGKGTRLKPITCGIPKPMVSILDKPVMEYSIELLKRYNIKDIVVTLAYMPSVIRDYFHTGAEWDVNLDYFIEESPLGTGGSVKNADEVLDNTFVVISGDAMTDIDIEKAVQYHKEKKSKATLILKKEPIPLEYGVVIIDNDGKILRFLEKPSWGEVFSNTVNTGIYILEPEILKYYKKGDKFDFSKDLFPKLLRDNIPMYGYITDEYWNDIGDLKSYIQTQFDLLDKKVKHSLNCKEISEGIWIDEGTNLNENVKIKAPAYISKNCTIKSGVSIEPYTFIGENCIIGEGAKIKRSIIWENTNIGRNSHLSGTAISSNVNIRNNVNIYEHSAIGCGCEINDGVIIKPNTLIWPDKKIGENLIINQNLVWGTKTTKNIFGNRDITGDINIDITPEFASRLGSAFVSIIKGEPQIVVTSDKSNACNVIKNSIISGVLSTGAGVVNIKEATIPMNRFALNFFEADGGIHIRLDYTNENKVHIEFIDKKGANIDRNAERKIENLLNRDDFQRCNANKVKDVVEIDKFSSLYIQNGSKILENISKIKRHNPKIIIRSMCKNVLSIASDFLEYIGCQVDCQYSNKNNTNEKKVINSLSDKVVMEKADLGIVFSSDGERLIIIDDKGTIVSEDRYIGLASLILLKLGAKRIIVPYTASRIIDRLAENYKAKVIRTKTSSSSIINTIFEGDNEVEGYLQYLLNYDAILAACVIIDFIIGEEIKINKLLCEIPKFFLIRKEIKCDWKDKGRVIKELIVNHNKNKMELYEGVKIFDNKGWALVIPDSEKSTCKVYTEGYSEEYAEELSRQFIDKVEKIIGVNNSINFK